MTILVPGWSRVDFFLRNRYKINYFYIFTIYDILPDDKWLKLGIDNIYLDKNWKMLDIVNTAKTGPGSERLDMVAYFYWIWEK